MGKKQKMNKRFKNPRLDAVIDAEILCFTCKTFYTIHDMFHSMREDLKEFDIEVLKGSGIHLSGMICPNCFSKDLDFDLVLTNPKYDIKELIESRMREKEGKEEDE